MEWYSCFFISHTTSNKSVTLSPAKHPHTTQFIWGAVTFLTVNNDFYHLLVLVTLFLPDFLRSSCLQVYSGLLIPNLCRGRAHFLDCTKPETHNIQYILTVHTMNYRLFFYRIVLCYACLKVSLWEKMDEEKVMVEVETFYMTAHILVCCHIKCDKDFYKDINQKKMWWKTVLRLFEVNGIIWVLIAWFLDLVVVLTWFWDLWKCSQWVRRCVYVPSVTSASQLFEGNLGVMA